jgi:hypothetical protein
MRSRGFVTSFFTLALCFAALCLVVAGARAGEARRTGYPVANFGIGAEVTPEGGLITRIIYNPPEYGKWLEDVAEGYFSFGSGGADVRDEEMAEKKITRRWPFASYEAADPRLPGARIGFSAFAPVAKDDAFDTSLPAVLVEFNVKNGGSAETEIEINYHCAGRTCAMTTPKRRRTLWLSPMDGLSISSDAPAEKTTGPGSAVFHWKLKIPPSGAARLRIAFFRYHRNGFYAGKLKTHERMSAYLFENWDDLAKRTSGFDAAIPATGSQLIDDSLRWYMTAGVLLTKLAGDGNALTMGYSELNQRDSYWTSFIHLVYWPELDVKMMEESAAAQRPDGKIPTTILPVIERDTDIDINCYFGLRLLRRASYWDDTAFLRRQWPALKSAVSFVAAMDTDGDGLPEQKDFWADWKDVYGIEGRKYGPHFALLWAALLKHASKWAAVLGDADAARDYSRMYDKALDTINKPVGEGGLWNGSYYINVWNDRRKDDAVSEDQVVGILFGVVDGRRADSIFSALAANETGWGVRETFPYRPESFGIRGGDYHNGAIWPYLNFVDALARIRSGRREDGARIMEEVARADLYRAGDYLPHENIDGETGENTHKWLQGWDADFFAAVMFGLMQPDARFFEAGLNEKESGR